MSITLRIILILGSILSLVLCLKKIHDTKLKIGDSITWIFGCLLLIFMSIFSNLVEWVSSKLGFVAPVNFVFLLFIFWLMCQIFLLNLKLSELNEKIKNIDHYLALKEKEERSISEKR